MNEKTARIVRIIFAPPICAGTMLSILWIVNKNYFLNLSHYLLAMFFLFLLPLLAYPISLIGKRKRKDNRTFQRNLAIIFSVLGYVLGFAFCLIFDTTKTEFLFYGTYFFSGLFIFTTSFIFKFKASGHSCSLSGPIIFLSFVVSPFCLFGYLLLLPNFASALTLKRHTTSQLAIGMFIPVLSLYLAYFSSYLFYAF